MQKRKQLSMLVHMLVKSAFWLCAAVGVLSIILLLLLSGRLGFEKNKQKLPERFILSLNLDGSFYENDSDSFLNDFSEAGSFVFSNLVFSLQSAVQDERVAAIALEINDTGLGFAQLQEVRSLLEKFKTSGRKVYAYSSSFGTAGGGNDEYYLASVADEIVLMPGGELGLTGIFVEMPFMKNLLDKVGVQAEFYTRFEYKNAYVSLTDTAMPEPVRQNIVELADGLWKQLLKGISTARGIKTEYLQKLTGKAPFSCEKAKEYKLVDNCDYAEEASERLKQEYGVPLIPVEYYQPQEQKHKKKIALLNLEGVIEQGTDMLSTVGGNFVNPANVKTQLNEIADISDLSAVVVRINSPGGDYAASKEIWHLLRRFKQQKNVPLWVSMGNYAASGGYFMALAGDKIYAESATITGSIGVVGGKPVLTALWQKLGIDWAFVKTGENAGISSFNKPFSEKEKVVFNNMLDDIYSDFTLTVADARGLTMDKVELLSRGRVWLGKEAVENGLIDEIGGLEQVIAEAGGYDADILSFPKPKSFSEKLKSLLGEVPATSSNRMIKYFGVESNSINMLHKLNYNLILWPFEIR